MAKYAVVGSRTMNDYDALKKVLDGIVKEGDTIVSGGAKGADSLAERYAQEKGLETLVFKPDWKRYGRGAGMVRNKTIADNSDTVVAFWDGESKGTKHTIDYAKKTGKKVLVCDFAGNLVEEG